MDIELYFADTKAIVTSNGAYVTNLSDLDGDIFFPKRTLKAPDGSEKVRGGSHVCLPNFGPGGASGQDQHGYGRTSKWKLVSSNETTAQFRLDGTGDYKGLVATVEYIVGDCVFESRLTLENTSDHAIVVAPAFHPYFSHKGSVAIDGSQQAILDDFKEAVFVAGSKHILRTDLRLMTLQSDNLPKWAQWTDQLATYICIEPTQSGFSFSEDMNRADQLAPGNERQYSMTVAWSPVTLEN
jgi:galactose mutarotase-like enzyme